MDSQFHRGATSTSSRRAISGYPQRSRLTRGRGPRRQAPYGRSSTSAVDTSDTPPYCPLHVHTLSKHERMSGIRTRPRQAGGSDEVLLQGRVSRPTREQVQRAAADSGVSIAYYLEALIAQLVDERGALPRIDDPRSRSKELPITDVA
jgi:hypothetical protein